MTQSTYISPSRRSLCSRCGKVIGLTRTSAVEPRCLACHRADPWRKPLPVERWVCGWCGVACERKPTRGQRPKFCDDQCAQRSRLASRAQSRGEFSITRTRRRAIYERDDWTCRICGEPTSRGWSHDDQWSPTLDHIEPQSHALIPDHSDANLRTAHWICNRRRSDGRMTDDEVRALALARTEEDHGPIAARSSRSSDLAYV